MEFIAAVGFFVQAIVPIIVIVLHVIIIFTSLAGMLSKIGLKQKCTGSTCAWLFTLFCVIGYLAVKKTSLFVAVHYPAIHFREYIFSSLNEGKHFIKYVRYIPVIHSTLQENRKWQVNLYYELAFYDNQILIFIYFFFL